MLVYRMSLTRRSHMDMLIGSTASHLLDCVFLVSDNLYLYNSTRFDTSSMINFVSIAGCCDGNGPNRAGSAL